MSPGVALGYLFWTRHRRGLKILPGYLMFIIVFCHIVSGGPIDSMQKEELWGEAALVIFRIVFLFLLAGLLPAFGYLLCIFIFSREVRKFEACESGFPARLRHLPLSATALAGWPILWGSVTVMLVWLVLAWGAFRPCGFPVPLGWPALLLAVVLAWVQAIIWTPFPLPWVRALLFIPVGSILVFVPMALLAFDVTEVFGYILLILLLPAAYLTAIHGVSRARRGENEHWNRPAWLRWPWKTARPRPPFTSAAQAQLWFEWRLGRLAFPLGLALSWLTLLPFLTSLSKDEERLFCVLAPLLSSLVLAIACGAEIGRLPGKSSFSSFLATRPLSTGMLARIKFEAAMWITVEGWAGIIVGLMSWLALSSHGREMVAEQIEAMRQHYSPAQFWIGLLLLAGGPVLLIWMQMAGTLWVALGYREDGDHPGQTDFFQMLENWGVSILRQVWSVGSVLVLFVVWIWLLIGGKEVGLPGPPQTRIVFLTWLAGCVVVLKCLAAAWSLSRLKRNDLVPAPIVLGALMVWIDLAIGLLLLLRWLIPGEIVPMPGLVLGIALLLPLTRLTLAPLALNCNRHR